MFPIKQGALGRWYELASNDRLKNLQRAKRTRRGNRVRGKRIQGVQKRPSPSPSALDS